MFFSFLWLCNNCSKQKNKNKSKNKDENNKDLLALNYIKLIPLFELEASTP